MNKLPTEISLGYTPRDWQQQVHDAVERFKVIAAHRRSGKTLLAIMELIDCALRAGCPSLFAYVAPLLKMAVSICWAELKRVVEPLRLQGAVEVRESDLQITFKHNGAVIRLFGADNPDALRGLRLDGVVIDEIGHVRPELWTEVVRPALSDRKGWMLAIGTPAGINLFSELFFRAPSLPDWCAMRFTVYETNALDAEEVERLQVELPPNAFKREFLSDFDVSADDQLLSLSDVQLAAERSYPDREIAHAPKIVGVDPARFGDDRSVIVKRQGLVMLAPIVMHGIDNMQLAARVAEVIQTWRPDATFIDSGGGAGTIDRLFQLGYNPFEVAFGGKAMRPTEFNNRRTEMWSAMGDWIRSGGAIPPDDMTLRQELATPVFSFDAHGRKCLESKDAIKKRLPGAASPDVADALALTFASPVAARPSLDDWPWSVRMHREAAEYDPYKNL